MSLTIQYFLLAAIGVLCLAFVIRSQLPGLWRRGLGRLALWAVQEQNPVWLKSFGRRIAPAPRATQACAGCSTDEGCH